jgi:dolichyl-diphosphooligosaccharide--protein glycosyltransferase/undecaprenyl-diphosphooligosaccharide--protein glycosyltransferase
MSENKSISTKQLIGLMVLAYAFSFLIRMIWVYQFYGTPEFMWNGQLMINTNDGYFFASGAQKELFGMHADNPRVYGMWDYGVIFFTTLFAKITPFSLETVTLYMPAVVSSLVVIPIILISRLYGRTLWGFFAALLGSIAWSYYNRTMTGYYDTDMFSAMAPMFILYFLIKSTIDFNLKSALYAALAIVWYPFLYDQGLAIVYAMGILYGIYMVWYHRNEKMTYASLILVFLALVPLKALGIGTPYTFLFHTVLILLSYMVLQKGKLSVRQEMVAAGILFVIFLLLGNVFGLIIAKIMSYTIEGTQEGALHFFAVNQTVREAGQIPFSIFANRISGSVFGVILAAVGYIVLVWKHRAFILALPLVGIGIFALWGGLRFTVYAVPVAAMSAVFLFVVIGEYIKDYKLRLALLVAATSALLYPNIMHIINYRVPTVFKHNEVKDLDRLRQIATSKDYVLTWWDYGYPVWYYSNTNTLIDGGKHNNDNFIISTIMQTTSPKLAANFSRLAVETYVDSNYTTVTKTLFEKEKDPDRLLSKLAGEKVTLPEKSRDIYLYMPYRMLTIFPTVMLFGNIDLKTGKPKYEPIFYPTQAISDKKGVLQFRNGLVFDTRKGEIHTGNKVHAIRQFIIAKNDGQGKVVLKAQNYDLSSIYTVIYMQSYGQFIVLDNQTLHSMYVQMFILGRYDKNLFEPVVVSPYARIYKLKK